MHCSKCGTPIPEGAAFCPACGHPAVSFAPPEPEPGAVVARRPLIYAGFWLRGVAAVVDTLLLTILLSPFVYYLFARAGLPVPPAPPPTIAEIDQKPESVIAVEAILFVTMGLYFSLMESSPLQATLGKRLVGIKVTGLDGKRVSFGRATGRYFAKLASNFSFGIGYLMAGFTQRKQALHDVFSECLVIRDRRRGRQ